jgi:hypothetical protein
MNDMLLLGLAIGAAIIVFTLAYNAWQERAYRKRAERDFAHLSGSSGTRAPDVLMSDSPLRSKAQERTEPLLGDVTSLDPQPLVKPPTSAARPVAPPVATPAEWEDSLHGARLGEQERGMQPAISHQIDAVAHVVAPRRIDPMAIEQFKRSLRDLRHPVLLETMQDGVWQPLSSTKPNDECRELQIGLQLANRAGAVSSEEYAHFTGAVETFAEIVEGAAQFEPPHTTLERAQQIDQFAADVDMEVVISLVKNSSEPFTHAELDSLAGELSLTPQTHAYVAQNQSGGQMYLLRPEFSSHQEATSRDRAFRKLSFALDVPHVAEGRNAWIAMLEAANRACGIVDARLVDDTEAPLTANGLDKLQRLIDRAQEQSAARGVPAGSKLAKRLFS